ncbi:MAG: hypothetical protein QXH08_06320 [Candidatus Hadarchaeales archaeon]
MKKKERVKAESVPWLGVLPSPRGRDYCRLVAIKQEEEGFEVKDAMIYFFFSPSELEWETLILQGVVTQIPSRNKERILLRVNLGCDVPLSALTTLKETGKVEIIDLRKRS